MMQLNQFLTGNTKIFYERFGNPVHPDFVGESKMISNFVNTHPLLKVPVNLSNFCIRYELDKFIMLVKNIDLMTIVNKLRENQYLYVVHTPEVNEKIVIRIYIKNNYKTDIDIETIKELNISLMNSPIRGVSGIKRCYVIQVPRTKINDDNSISSEKESIYAIKTAGINFEDLMFNKDLDVYNMYCDSVVDTQKIYGINAARNKLVNEVRITIPGINYSNYTLLADELMTLGYSSKINHYGVLERYPNNLLLQLSDSYQIQVLTQAAIRNKKQKISDVSSHIMIGSVPNIGSLYPRIIVNEDMMMRNNVTVDTLMDEL
jgi:hypothetical protein